MASPLTTTKPAAPKTTSINPEPLPCHLTDHNQITPQPLLFPELTNQLLQSTKPKLFNLQEHTNSHSNTIKAKPPQATPRPPWSLSLLTAPCPLLKAQALTQISKIHKPFH
jgi:hypothetical protein